MMSNVFKYIEYDKPPQCVKYGRSVCQYVPLECKILPRQHYQKIVLEYISESAN